jgi:ABC-type transport system involved in multi-copper enzyme maturation permease subunit
MRGLISFELKKIIQKRSTIYAILTAIILSLSSFFFGVMTETSYITETEKLKGLQAIENERNIQGQFSGYLTDEYIKKVELEANQNSPKYWRILPSIGVQEVRFPNIISDLTAGNVNGIYDHILKGPSADKPRLTSNEVDKLLIMYRQVQLPFYYDYYDGWEKMSSSFSVLVALIVSAIIVICLSPVFSEEYSQKTDAIILTTKHGKNKVIIAKLISSLLFTISVFLLFASLNFTLYATIYGLGGFNANIQKHGWYYQSPYNMTFLDLNLFSMGLSLIGLLFIAVITLFISSKVKSPYITVILSASLLYIPKIDLSEISYTANIVLELFPINMMNSAEHFELGVFYNLFGTPFLQPIMMIFTATVISVLLLTFAYNTFKNHQV